MNESESPRQTLLAKALEIEDARERAAFLSRACGNDSALRQEIEELIQAHAAARGFLPSKPVSTGAAALAGMAAALGAGDVTSLDPLTEKPGDRIGRYKLLERVGEGGCGVVYVAEQTDPVRRRVALKVIKLGMDTRQVVARFEAERQALAMMDHPNIAKVLDAGTTESGRPYFVMELVRGIRITDYCDQDNLTTKERLDLFIKVCQAIQHAHQKGIIHRDIKPSNILVTLHDGVPVPKVIDFGIAKATEGRLTDNTVYTQLHQFIGTPAYMSPEQAEMSGLDIDTRSDIYSLGVLLYELLAGSTPFDAKELMASGIDAMRKTIREKEPARPSTRLATLGAKEQTTTAKRRSVDSSKLLHQLKGDLDWIVMKCLEKDRTRRYETASGLAADLARHLKYEPVLARPPSAAYKFQKAFRRNKLVFTAAAAVIVALLAGVIGSAWEAIRAKRAEVEQTRLLQAARVAQAAEARERQRAVANEISARQSLYAAHMLLAQQALSEGNHGFTRALLRQHLPNGAELGENTDLSADVRGWEWRYLWGESGSDEAFTLGRHSAGAFAVAFSPKGKLLASSGGDNTVKLWDLESRRLIETLKHDAGGLAFSPDGRWLACAGSQSVVSLWDAETGKFARTLTNGFETFSVVFSPDGNVLASGGEGVRLWSVGSWEEIARFEIEGTSIISIGMAFSADSRYFAYPRNGRRIELWDSQNRSKINTLTNTAELVRSLRFSSDGRALISANHLKDNGGSLVVFDLGTRKSKDTLANFVGWAGWMALSPDGSMLAVPSADHKLYLFDASNWQQTAVLEGHEDEVWAADFSPDGKWIATAGRDGTVRIWDAHLKPRDPSFVRFDSDCTLTALSPGGDTVATLQRDGTYRLWDTAKLSGRERRSLPAGSGSLSNLFSAAVSRGGEFLALGYTDGSIVLLDTQKGRAPAHFNEPPGPVFSVSFSSDGKVLAAARENKGIEVYEVSSGRILAELSASGRKCFSIAFSEDRQFLAATYDTTTVEIWNVDQRRRIAQWAVDSVKFAALSHDGHLAASAGWAPEVRLLDVLGQRELIASRGIALTGYCMCAFSPDGRRLAAADLGGKLRVIDTTTGLDVLLLPSKAEFVAFLADGDTLVSVNDSGIHRWQAASPGSLSSPSP